MAHIAPSIAFVRETLSRMEQGQSLAQSLDQLVGGHKDPFNKKMNLWWQMVKNGHEPPQLFVTHYQRCFVELIQNGLLGAPIYDHLIRLELEMMQEFERQWKVRLENLPLQLSLPLLLCFFPAYMLLLFGPLVAQFLLEVQ